MITTPWQVQFLGGLRLFREGSPPVCRLRTAKTTALFAFLCAHPGRDQGRDDLVDRFWPDLPFDAGRNSLRIALSALRRVLNHPEASAAEAVLMATRFHVRLCAGAVQTDVALFEAALRRGDQEAAAVLAAQGPFLPGINDEWVYAERDRLDELRQQVLEGTALRPVSAVVAAPTIQPGPLVQSETRVVSGRVPQPLGRFFGREAETARLLGLLADPTIRLITVTGPGGTGKTRLMLETARLLRDGKAILPPGLLRGGIWFVPLVAATHGGHLLPAICQVVGASLAGGDCDALEILSAHLATLNSSGGGGRTVLLLDNLEQVEAESGATVLGALLQRIPALVCLTTSRRRLGLLGERVVALEPFPLPHEDDSPTTLAVHPAVALFVDRAREADVDFALTPRRTASVVDLCVRLNGVPLALEMAASWAGVYTPDEMTVAIGKSVGGLTGRHAGRESRHRSLREVADWSFRLLPPEARRLLAVVSVFEGRWTKNEAAQVAADVPAFSPEPLALLCDHSLVRGETDENGERYFEIGPVLRPFARELLTEAGTDTVTEARYRHARYFSGLAPAEPRDVRRLPDVYAALAFWESANPNNALRLVGALWGYWWRVGQWDDAQAVVSRVLVRVTDDTAVAAPDALSEALRCAGKLAFYRRDFAAARALAHRRIAVETRCGNTGEVLLLRANLATFAAEEGRFADAKAAFEEILPHLPGLGADWKTRSAYVENNYADTLLALGLTADARTVTEAHLREIAADGQQRRDGITGLHWGRMAAIHRTGGNLEAARRCAENSLAIFRECGEIFRVADALLLLSGIMRESGDGTRAREVLRESFALRRRVPSDDGFRRSVAEAKLLLPPAVLPAALSGLPPREAFLRAGEWLEEVGA